MVRKRKLYIFVIGVLSYTFAIFSISKSVKGGYSFAHTENNLFETRQATQRDKKQEFEKENSNCTNCVNKLNNEQTLGLIYGPGAGGVGVKFGDTDLKYNREVDEKYRFKTFISDSIGFYRTVSDLRPPACKEKTYRKDLPPVSIVITYRDELPSVVLRTAYSVLQMSPLELIQEIVFVDDGSTDKELTDLLNLHVANVDKFKLIRNDIPLGLMKARMRGINATTTDYFIVMDGHMEVGPNWLEPLLERLLDKPNALLTSHVGDISTENFRVGIGPFDAYFLFFDHQTLTDLFIPYTQEFILARNHSVDTIPIGIIQGMITVMKKDYFYQLGGFDAGMEVWGFEQIELSVKVWMCGGTVELVPCSVVAHLFRPPPWGSYSFTKSHARNRARIASVWMDPPYKNYVLEPLKVINYTIGDVSDRVAIRRENNCKPYQYFIDKVKTISDAYIPENPKQIGLLYNVGFNKCLDYGLDSIGLYDCHGRHNQHFMLTEYSEFRSIGSKLIKVVEKDGRFVIEGSIQLSVNKEENAMWDYLDNDAIMNVKTGLCLAGLKKDSVGLENCTNSSEQTWTWGYRDDITKL